VAGVLRVDTRQSQRGNDGDEYHDSQKTKAQKCKRAFQQAARE
jgi:hypothetical protein